jgi:DHA1 family bicyclomycin/chloramphenicol resistance-like MFS transporter
MDTYVGRHAKSVVDVGIHKKRHVGRLILLGALSAFGPLSMDMYLPSTPTIAANLQASQSLVQLTMSGCLAGLAIGQLVAGPLSDGMGRRRPLLVGLVGFTVLSVACAAAPSIGILIALRFLQGMAGAAGVVLSLAMVRDLYEGTELARVLGSLTLVFGLGPVLAPVIGGQILRFTNWRGVFATLAVVGFILLVASCFLPETLPAEQRTPSRFRQLLRDSRTLFGDRVYSGNTLAVGFGTAALITYVSTLPFIIEDAYGRTPQMFSLFFMINAIGLTAMAQLGSRLVRKVSPVRLTRGALVVLVLGGIGFAAATHLGHPALETLLVPLFVFVSALGMMRPNATALAIARHPRLAGTASAYLGALQFMLSALLSPFAGIDGRGAAAPAGIIIGALCAAALAAQLLLARRPRATAPDTGPGPVLPPVPPWEDLVGRQAPSFFDPVGRPVVPAWDDFNAPPGTSPEEPAQEMPFPGTDPTPWSSW